MLLLIALILALLTKDGGIIAIFICLHFVFGGNRR